MIYEQYTNGQRIYVNSETKTRYPSVTTITSQRNPFKGKPGNAAHIGTLIHWHILRQYASGILPAPNVQIWGLSQAEVESRIQRALTMWRDLHFDDQFTFVDVEALVVSDTYRYAGRADGIGMDNSGNISVMDIKTGDFYSDYWLQGAAYAKATGATSCFFVQLDVNDSRNPDQIGQIHHMGSQEIEKHFGEFKALLEAYYNKL